MAAAAAAATARRPESRIQNPDPPCHWSVHAGQRSYHDPRLASRARAEAGPSVPRFLRHARNRNGGHHSDEASNVNQTKLLFCLPLSGPAPWQCLCLCARFVRAFWVCILPRPAPVRHNSRLAHGCPAGYVLCLSYVYPASFGGVSTCPHPNRRSESAVASSRKQKQA